MTMTQNKNSNSKMSETNNDEAIYAYFRNGVMYVTPDLNLAWNRRTHGDPEIIERTNDE
jgi:hypothetical protein